MIVERFRHDDGSFGDGTQTSYAFAGSLGLADANEMARRLAEEVEAGGDVLRTGIFGTTLAFGLLHDEGFDEVAERWILRTEDPSLLGMLSNGSGALAEQFHTNLSSLDHAMFSSYVQWMYQALGGITVADDAVAADHVEVRPYLSRSLDHVGASYRGASGTVGVAWTRSAAGVELLVDAPSAVRVDIDLPAGCDVIERTESGDVRRFLLVETA